jgi:hypothetical protein
MELFIVTALETSNQTNKYDITILEMGVFPLRIQYSTQILSQ